MGTPVGSVAAEIPVVPPQEQVERQESKFGDKKTEKSWFAYVGNVAQSTSLATLKGAHAVVLGPFLSLKPGQPGKTTTQYVIDVIRTTGAFTFDGGLAYAAYLGVKYGIGASLYSFAVANPVILSLVVGGLTFNLGILLAQHLFGKTTPKNQETKGNEEAEKANPSVVVVPETPDVVGGQGTTQP